MVRPIRLALEAIDKRLEDAASTLGANTLLVFLTVTLPLALPGIIAGMLLCFARALGEFGATITFVSNIPGETQTISALIYTLTQVPGGDAAAGRLVVVADRSGDGGADRIRIPGAPRRDTFPRGVIVLTVDVEKTTRRAATESAVPGRERRDGFVWPVGRRQDLHSST